ncbi:MAG: cytochrome c oxidase accessory protein CcoG [candidate division Zixibacteria bacterium]|jgi:cytochrome c oxidase accessory protein FixG|nr:cytochrome c oxidase accessory protein CcoG [candidate division Zixibacteria bacterium]
MVQHSTEQNSFRDTIATAEKSGRRIWIFPAKPKGRLYSARTVVAVFLLAFLFGAPFVRVNGEPLVLLNVLDRKFIIFGLVFWPQDFYLFGLALITFLVFVVLFTAVFGRLFCGWICPQTVFLEMVFRRIEYWIEGGPARQRKLAAQAWNTEKVFKRSVKAVLFFGISFLIGNTFLAYIIGTDQLFRIVTASPTEHLAGFVAVLSFSFLFYFVFAWFREQACTLVCPYGRLQGVLIDANSIVVAYDRTRGEPRAPMERGSRAAELGDCVDCLACVHVCPTGIDIRNGTQLECVNCTACIDACNRTMRKVGLPEGLIRYSSEAAITHGRRFRITGRVALYTVVFVLLSSLLTYLLVTRSSVETTVLRTPGSMYTETEDGRIRNLYTVKIINKSFERVPVELRAAAPRSATVQMVGTGLVVEPDGMVESAFFVDIPRDQIFSQSTLVTIEVYSAGEVVETVRTSFMGPGRRAEP